MKAGDTVFDGTKTRSVIKVGRVWATVEDGQAFRIEELPTGARLRRRVGSDRGTAVVYASGSAMQAIRDAQEAERTLAKLWAEFSQQTQRWRPPAGLTAEKVREAAAILGIKLGQKEAP